MKWKLLHAELSYRPQEGYLGHVHFEVDGHKQPYELTLFSEGNLDEWDYSLHFLRESGSEKEIEFVEQAIEEDDDFFDQLVEAAKARLRSAEE
jgi:hypothetical protein